MGRGLISDDVINQIKDRIDIAEIVGQHVSLTRAGQNLKGLLPLPPRKTPSFTVSSSRQIFHCFGCGAGGNVFTFLTRITGASFPETVRDLGHQVGIEIQDIVSASEPQIAQGHRLEQLNRMAAQWFQQNLQNDRSGAEARAYLAGRGILEATIERFGIGVAPVEWDGLIRWLGGKQGCTQQDMAAAGDQSRGTMEPGITTDFAVGHDHHHRPP